MARQKMAQELVRSKLAIAGRLAALRLAIFGERGGPEMARRLNIPARTWYNYEKGITVPAEIILQIIKQTSVEAGWLLDGTGLMFAEGKVRSAGPVELPVAPDRVIGTLLRTALHLLENGESPRPRPSGAHPDSEMPHNGPTAIGVAVAAVPTNGSTNEGRWVDKSVSLHQDAVRPTRRHA
jgi:hypothetical protein